MTWLILQSVALAAVIVVAGTRLPRYADALAQRWGLGRTLAGVVLLALATSLPEVAIGCGAALLPAPDLAVGDQLGSCLFNLLILAVLDLVYRSKGAMLSRGAAAHALSGVTCILLAAVALLPIIMDTSVTFWRFGLGPVLVATVYFFCLRLIAIDQRIAREDTDEPADGKAPAMSRRRAMTGYALAAGAILVAGPLLSDRADELAHRTGLGGTFVGSLMLALVTSLPEVSTTRAALKMGAVDMAVGNVFGSNAFNLVILLPIDLCFGGGILAAVEPAHAITLCAVIIVTAIAVLGMLYHAEKRIWFIEPDAALMIALIIGAYVLLYFQ